MLRVGLTGNIATGKSHASTKFAELGAYVIDADRIAHSLLDHGNRIHKKIVEAFGDVILRDNGSIDRKALGSIIFFDPGKRLVLNSLMHPAIDAEIRRNIDALEREHRRGILIIDAALMIEVGSHVRYHSLIVMRCSPSIQISRLMERDNLSFETAKARIDSQMPMEEKLKVADYIIDTSGTFKQTQDQIETVYRQLLLLEMNRSESGT